MNGAPEVAVVQQFHIVGKTYPAAAPAEDVVFPKGVADREGERDENGKGVKDHAWRSKKKES
jgi:hypothetical protein